MTGWKRRQNLAKCCSVSLQSWMSQWKLLLRERSGTSFDKKSFNYWLWNMVHVWFFMKHCCNHRSKRIEAVQFTILATGDAEMPTSGDLKSADFILFCPPPPLINSPTLPKKWPSPPRKINSLSCKIYLALRPCIFPNPTSKVAISKGQNNDAGCALYLFIWCTNFEKCNQEPGNETKVVWISGKFRL